MSTESTVTSAQIKKLPEWADYKRDNDGQWKVFINPDQAYPYYLEELGLSRTQFGVEVARKCMTDDMVAILGDKLIIRIVRNDNDNWLLSKLPEGTTPDGKPYPPGTGGPMGAANYYRYYEKLLQKRGGASA